MATPELPRPTRATVRDEWSTRNDIVGTNGKVTIRYAGRLYHLGIGRAYGGKHILMVITDNHVTTSLKETGEIITEHYIDLSLIHI